MTKKSRSKGIARELSAWVRYARGARDIRTFSIASSVGIGQISQLETRKSANPEWDTLQRIASASEGRCNPPVLTIDPAKV